MATDSLFKSNLDDTCNGTMYEGGIGCSARAPARYNGWGNIVGNPNVKKQDRTTISLEIGRAVGLDERLGQKELTTETTSTEISTEPTKKYKTMATPIVQTSKLMTPKPSLSTD